MSENTPFYLIGNKTDLADDFAYDREISSETAQAKAQELGMKYLETSAKTGVNVNKVFIGAAKHAYKNLPPHQKALNEIKAELEKVCNMTTCKFLAETDPRQKRLDLDTKKIAKLVNDGLDPTKPLTAEEACEKIKNKVAKHVLKEDQKGPIYKLMEIIWNILAKWLGLGWYKVSKKVHDKLYADLNKPFIRNTQ